ncbi:MAG TPA: tetratricopeptide repeat protein, partial [Bryobacteraceae bacterium]|nr:tetratricopeptide repeat protein [Bryobacteraceae bacterium]
ILADEAGLSAEEIRPPLERAIALRPEFDDAHYQLALLEKNAGHYEAALQELHALRTVTDARAYAYWLALADTYNELGRREDAQTAARHAIEHSASSDERARAQRQIYTAQTDPSVRFSRDAAGQLQLVTTRVPHGQSDSNPFIEPSDDMHRVQGMLRDIDCGDVTTVRIEQAGKLLKLTIPDLRHVQMTHAPAEFVCGSQTPASVTVDYARTPNSSSDGIVRGMEFMSSSAR